MTAPTRTAGSAAAPAIAAPRAAAGCPLDMNRRLLAGFLDRLEAEASFGAIHGCFDLTTLRTLAEDYLSETGVAAVAPQDCLRLHDTVLWEDRRNRPFERLLTRRFSALLPERAGDEGGPAAEAPLSRRLIPGLMAALGKMVGAETLDRAGQETERLLARHRESRLGLVDWPALAAEPAAQRVADDVLVIAARHIRPVPRRLEWLTMVINSHLGPVLREDHDPAWRCTPDRAGHLLAALYAPLRRADRAALAHRHGEEAVTALDAVLEELARLPG